MILVNFHFFRNWALSQLLTIANNELIAKIEADDIYFSPIDGIVLKDVRMLTAGDTLAQIGEINLSFNFSDLLENNINVYHLKLIDAKVRLLRNKDSVWNYDLIAPPSTGTTTSDTKIEIFAESLIFENTDFIYYDSTFTRDTSGIIDFSHFHFKNINLKTLAKVSLSENDFYLDIRNISLVENYTNANVKNLEGEIGINKKGPYAKNMKGKLDDTDFEFSASLDNFNAFGEETPLIENAEMKLNLITNNLQQQIVEYFYKMPIKIGTAQNGIIDISGNLYDLNVNKLNLLSADQEIYISGKLKDIPIPEKFRYDLDISSSIATDNSLKATLPDIDLSDLPKFNKVNFRKLKAMGSSNFVETDFDFTSALGNAKGIYNLKFEDLSYSGELEFSNIDLSKILKDNEYSSKLNGKVKAEGIDFDFNKLLIDLELELYRSNFRSLNIEQLYTDLDIQERKIINIDSLKLRLDRINEWAEIGFNDYYNERYGDITLGGVLDFSNMNSPKYSINSKLTAIDLNQFLSDEKLPDHLTCNINIDGKGFHIDSLDGNYQIEVEELLFKDRAVFPFAANFNLQNIDSVRTIIIDSDYITANMKGKFITSQLIDGLSQEGVFLGQFVSDKLNRIKPDFDDTVNDSLKVIVENISYFPKIDGEFYADIRDISIVNTFLDSLEINSNMVFKLNIYSDSSISSINIDTLDINFLKIQSPDFVLQTTNLNLNSELYLEIQDSVTKFRLFNLNIDKCQFFVVNNTNLFNPNLKMDFDGEILNFNGSVGFSENFKTKTKGNIILQKGGVDIHIDSGELAINDSVIWSIKRPFIANSYGEIFKISKIILEREGFEKIELSGGINNNSADKISININNLVSQNLIKIFNPTLYEDLKTLSLTMDTININVNGNLNRPTIDITFKSDSLYFNNVSIGTFNGNFIHREDFITGNIISRNNLMKEVINLNVVSLPIYLGLDSNKSMVDSNKIFDIRMNVSKLPAGLLLPFAAGINSLKGDIDANIVVDGYLPDKIKWGGKFDISKGEFWVDNTNIKYLAEAKTEIIDSRLYVREAKVRNTPEDILFGRIGTADVTGYVNIDNFKPGFMDMKINADRILGLSEASSATMPDLYGNFIMSSGENPIRFYGTLQEPNLDGDINVMYASIKMPLFEKRKSVRTSFNYQLVGDKYKVKIKNERDTSDSQDQVNIASEQDKNLLDLMNFNLRIKILGQFGVNMDMELIGEMNAIIGTPDKTVPLIYQKNRNNKEASLFGEVIVKEQSIIKSLKQFNTSGNVSFPTGSIENPTLDLIATHTGTSYSGSTKSQYLIKMYITGTKLDPKVRFQYFIDRVEGTGSQEQINEDALYLLALGRTKNSISQTQGNSNLINEGLVSGFSNFANKALSDLLASTGVIQSAALDFRGGALDLNQATVKFSGQLYGGISWTFGGSLSDISGDNEITLDIPASEFLENPFWSNFILQLTKASSTTTMVTQDAKNWEIKVKFGNSW